MVQFLPQPQATNQQGFIAPPGGVVAAPPAPASDVFDLKSLLGVLLRRKYLVLGAMVVFVGFVAVVLEQIDPVYRGEAEIIVEDGGSPSLGISSTILASTADQSRQRRALSKAASCRRRSSRRWAWWMTPVSNRLCNGISRV